MKDLRAPDGGLTLVVEAGGRNLKAVMTYGDSLRTLECSSNIKCRSSKKSGMKVMWCSVNWDIRTLTA